MICRVVIVDRTSEFLYDTAKAPKGQESIGIANDQIQEALPDADGDGAVDNQPSTPRGDEGLYRGDGSDGPSQESPRFNQQPTGVAGILAQRIQGSPDGPTARGAVPDVQEVKGLNPIYSKYSR